MPIGMAGRIKFKGSPMALVGRKIGIGKVAPDFKVVSTDLKEITLADFKDKVKIINSFPSLDTPVCDLQVKEFNKKALACSDETMIMGISKDLPFAQKRFCQANAIQKEIILSDYMSSSFGINYGLLIKELNLLARAVIIIDKNEFIRYIQVVPELTSPLDYEDALNNLNTIIKNPPLSRKDDNLPSRCKPCEGGTPPLSKERIQVLLAGYHGWQVIEDRKITKEFKFNDFIEAKYFLDMISMIAQEQGHHPSMNLSYNKIKVTFTTHAAGGLTENDFVMAGIIDELGGG